MNVHSINVFDVTARDITPTYNPDAKSHPVVIEVGSIQMFFETVNDFAIFTDRLRMIAIDIAIGSVVH